MNSLILFIYGAILGSGANALIDRLPKKQSWFTDRSHCDKCKHVLSWQDLLPIISFLILGGKCRYCHSPILVRNMIVEIVTGLGFVFLGLQSGTVTIYSIILMGIFWVTVIIAVMDWETKLVSEVMVGLWMALILIGQLFNLPASQLVQSIFSNIAGLVTGIVIIGGIWAVTKGKAMGAGDVEIAAVLGWWLGWPVVLTALWIAFVSGALIGTARYVMHLNKLKDEIAFGPFLVLGSWVGFFWGEKLWRLTMGG